MYLFLSTLLFAVSTLAAPLFEGYYKVSQMDQHIGFIIVRHSVDAKTSQYQIQTYLRLGKRGFDMTETVNTTSDSSLKPLKYSYTGMDKNKSKIIDLELAIDKKTKAEALTGFGVEAKNKLTLSIPIEKGVFFSSALYPMMLRSPSGIKTDTNFEFSAVAEETAQVHTGSAKIEKNMVTLGNQQVFKAKNSFAGSNYDTFINPTGEILSTNDSTSGIKTELVRNKEEAIQDIKVNKKTIEKIFGAFPEGKINSLHAKK